MMNVRGLSKWMALVGCALAVPACGGGGGGGPSPEYIAACNAALSEMGMPFDYTTSPTEVQIQGADATMMHLVFGPWGAHNSPHTGHAPGNAKADMMAVLANGPTEMTALDGSPCVAYTESTPNCGLPQTTALAMRPYYELPDGFSAATLQQMADQGIGYEITAVFVKRKGVPGTNEWFYWDSPDQWEVVAEICGLQLGFGHLGSIGAELKQALVDRGVSVNFDDYDGTLDENLVVGDPIATLTPGTLVGYPQLPGRPVPAGGMQAVAYAVPHDDTHVLWAQIEFGGARYPLEGGDAVFFRNYDLLDASEYSLWESILHLEMDDPNSARYGTPLVQGREWLWRAEGNLNHSPAFSPSGTENGLLRRLGDWWESYPGCGDADQKCDELIAFNRIDRSSPGFDASFYDAGSNYLIWWLRTGDTPQDGYYGEILSADSDLLADSTGQILVYWRDFNGGGAIDGSLGTLPYQYLSWRRGADDSLIVARGASAMDPGSATPVAIPAADATCDGKDVTCHTGFNENVRTSNIDGQL